MENPGHFSAEINRSETLTRWQKPGASLSRLVMNYDSAGKRHKLEFSFEGKAVNFVHDNNLAHSPPGDVSIVHVGERAFGPRPRLDDIETLCQSLSVTPQTVRNLIAEIERNSSEFLENMRIYEDDPSEWLDEGETRETPYQVLDVKLSDRLEPQVFGSLSGSEMQRAFIEFGAALARERSRNTPTLLLLDGGNWSFDEGHLAEVARWLYAQPFQTMIALPDHYLLEEDIWRSWGQVLLERPVGPGRTSVA